MRALARMFGVALTLASAGCMLDFDQFQPHKDASVDRSAFDAGPLDAPDATFDDSDEPDAKDARIDRVTVDRVAPVCSYQGGRVRLAHMASGVEAVRLCTRSRRVPQWTDVTSPDWTRGPLVYGQVTTYASLADTVTNRNDPREFLVVPQAQRCDGVETATQGVASLVVQLDPTSIGMLLLVTQSVPGSAPIAVLNFLDEKICTDCLAQNVEVRSIHAAYGAPYFIDFSFSPATIDQLPEEGRGLETRFGRNVGYGASMPGSDGYDCNAAWGAIARSETPIDVEFIVHDPVSNEIAHSQPTRLKTELLRQSRLATIFYAGSADRDAPTLDPMFVLCYEGQSDSGLVTCDRFRATSPSSDDDASVPSDAVHDASPDIPDATATTDGAPGSPPEAGPRNPQND